MYSTYNKGRSVVAERFITTLKKKIYKHMTAVSKYVYFDVLDDIVDEYSTYNEGRSVVAERFITTLKNKIYEHMTAVSKNVYFDILDDIADE